MKRRFFLLGFIFMILFSCNNASEEQESTDEFNEQSEVSEDKEDQDKSESIYYDISTTTFENEFTESAEHHFSSKEEKDKFKISIPAGNIKETKSNLSVTSKSGDTLIYKEFTTSQLVDGYALSEINSDEEVRQHIKDRAKENISENAIVDLEKEDNNLIQQSTEADFEDYDTYLSCKEQKLPLYVFSIGTENITYYGYSADLNKAVAVLFCC